MLKKLKMDITEINKEIKKIFKSKMNEFIEYQNTGACVINDEYIVDTIKGVLKSVTRIDKVIWYDHPSELPDYVTKMSISNFFYPQYLNLIISDCHLVGYDDYHQHWLYDILLVFKNIYGYSVWGNDDGSVYLHVIRPLKYSYGFEKNQGIYTDLLTFNKEGKVYKIGKGNFTEYEWLSFVKSAYLKNVESIKTILDENIEFQDYIFDEEYKGKGNALLDAESAIKMILPEGFDPNSTPKGLKDLNLAFKLKAAIELFAPNMMDEDGIGDDFDKLDDCL